MPSHQIQSPVWSLRKGCWTFAPFSNPGYALGGGCAGGGRDDDEESWSGWGGGSGGREDDEDACSGWGVVLVGGRMTRMLGLGSPVGSGGMRGVGRSLLFRLGWGRVRPFVVSFAWVGLEVAGLGGHGV